VRFGFSLILLAGFLSAQEPPPTQRPAPIPADPSESAPPKIQRGKPAPKPADPNTTELPPPKPLEDLPAPGKEATVDDSGKPVRPASSGPDQSDDLIERTRAVVEETLGHLPDFICDQLTYRSYSVTLKPDWQMKDRVEAELTWVHNKEDYRNLKINGKPIRKGSPEDSGTWSTGEFGSFVGDVFSGYSQASFTFVRNSSAAGMLAKVYDFSVRQPNSHWEVRYQGTIKPAYTGSVWIDPKTATVLRIEIQAREIKQSFALDHVETAIDYNWVRIGTQRYLMPFKSENITCFRGTNNCSMNQIEFRNYRKFTAESQVLQVESEISYPEAEKPKPPAKKQ
jgi:hypothetical protein